MARQHWLTHKLGNCNYIVWASLHVPNVLFQHALLETLYSGNKCKVNGTMSFKCFEQLRKQQNKTCTAPSKIINVVPLNQSSSLPPASPKCRSAERCKASLIVKSTLLLVGGVDRIVVSLSRCHSTCTGVVGCWWRFIWGRVSGCYWIDQWHTPHTREQRYVKSSLKRHD